MSHGGPRRVAVVGAGWAGLAAALDLAAAGCAVSLFEAGRRAGGRARSVDRAGLALDNGQHLLIGAYRETLDLLARTGIEEATVLRRLPLAVLAPPAFSLRLPRLPAPLHLLTGLLGARAPLSEKWAAIRFMRALTRLRFRLPRDHSVTALLDAHGQHGGLRRHLWEALCLAALNTAPAEASAQVFANVLRDSLAGRREATDLLIPTVPLGEVLPEPALRQLRRAGAAIHLGERIRGVHARADGWHLQGPTAAVGPFADVVLATAVQHLGTLLPAPADTHLAARADALRQQLGALAFEPIGTLYVRYPAAVRLPAPALQLAHAPGQWVFDRGQLGGPPGLIAHVLSARGEWTSLPAESLTQQLHGCLGAAVGTLPPPVAADWIVERRATFACRPDLRRAGPETPWPGLWLAGDHVAGDYPATLEGAVRSGREAARRVLSRAA